MPEFEAWNRYFVRLGWRPCTMTAAVNAPTKAAAIEITVPTQWPEWFDATKAARAMEPAA